MPLNEIVDITISRETTPIPRTSFGTILIVGPNNNNDNRLEYFTDPSSALEKITDSTGLEAAMVSDIFAQNPSVSRIALGGIQASRTYVFSGTFTDGSITTTVNGTDVTTAFTTDMDTTLGAHATAIQALADVTTAVYTAGTDTLVITPATDTCIGTVLDLSDVTGTLSAVLTSTELSETYAEALALILAEQSDWYGFVIADRTVAKQELAADWAESNKKIFIAGSADADIIDEADGVDVTSIAYHADSNTLDRTAVIYGANAATEGNDAAFIGKILPYDPGSYTAMFKKLASVTVDTLTPTQSTNARAKNANTYETIGGVNIVREGKVGSGEYLDTIIFIDWLEARLGEEIYALLASTLKVPFTSAGITAIGSKIDVVLREGQAKGGISPAEYDEDNNQIGGYRIDLPTLASISSTYKANRELPNVRWTAWLAGAIHKVTVTGVVTL